MRKELLNNYLFVSVSSKLRLAKLSVVTNIVSFRNMMKLRHPTYEIINDDYPLRLKHNERLIYRLMNKLSDLKENETSEYRTYKLDTYRVQTVIRLITGSKKHIYGNDELICERCKSEFIGDYSRLNDIYQFVNLDNRYCSDDCSTSVKKWEPQQRYCRCGNVFYPKENLQFDCNYCLNSVSKPVSY